MKKTFKVNGIDCASCANRLEKALNRIDGVTSAVVVFATEKLVLEAPDEKFDEILDKACTVCKKIEPEREIVR